MTGLQLILKQLGVNIDPKEIESEFTRIKELVPKFARDATEILKTIDARYERIEATQRLILERLDLMTPAPNDPYVLPAGTGAATRNAEMQWDGIEWKKPIGVSNGR